jgi:hypothetical protein
MWNWVGIKFGVKGDYKNSLGPLLSFFLVLQIIETGLGS